MLPVQSQSCSFYSKIVWMLALFLALWQPDRASNGLSFWKPLWFDAALVNKLVLHTWLLSGALEVWRLQFLFYDRGGNLLNFS